MKFVKEFVVPAAVLTGICVVISGALVLTYNTTEPIIEAAKAAEADAARIEVLADADKFEKVETTVEGVVDAYKAVNGAGYVITAEAKGYGGPMQVMVGIKSDGTIDSVKLMSNSETAGLGTKTGEPAYTDQYKGKDSTLDGVEAVSGATISSTAFKTNVQNAFKAYGELAGVEVSTGDTTTPEQAIFPNVENFEEITLDGAVKAMKAGDEGYLIVTEAQGYMGAPTKMQVYTGIGLDGKIVGAALGENSEPAGLGTRTGGAAYTDQYKGKDSTDGITAVSGATQSSDGFKKAVDQALQLAAGLVSSAPAEETSSEASEAPAASGTEVTLEGTEKAIAYEDGSMEITTTGKGYMGDVIVTVTIGADGKITAMSVNADVETKGVGTKTSEAAYTDTWVGKGAGETPDAVSGATVSSNAVNEAVQKAFTAFNASKGA